MSDQTQTPPVAMSRYTRGRPSAAPAADVVEDTAAVTDDAAPRGRSMPAEKVRIHPFIWMMFAAFFLPIEASIFTAGLLLNPLKVLLLLLAIPSAFMFMSASTKKSILDVYFMIFVLYTFMAIMIKRGSNGLEPAVVYTLETAVIYMATRVSIRTEAEFKAVMGLFIKIMVVLCVLAIPEAVFKVRFLHDIASAISGLQYPHATDERMGMLRANSTFEHPILFGLSAGALLTYTWIFTPSKGKATVMAAAIFIGAFFSLTSAAMLVLILQSGILIGERLTRGIARRVQILVYGLVGIYAFLSVASDRGPIGLVSSYLILNPHTGYYRQLIWTHGIDDVLANPILGINPEQWTRPWWMTSSIDNFWLLSMMRSGLPGFAFLILFLVTAITRMRKMGLAKAQALAQSGDADADAAPAGRRAPARGPAQKAGEIVRGIDMPSTWIITMVVLAFGGATVAFFGKMQPIYSFHLALGPVILAFGAAAKTTPKRGADRQR